MSQFQPFPPAELGHTSLPRKLVVRMKMSLVKCLDIWLMSNSLIYDETETTSCRSSWAGTFYLHGTLLELIPYDLAEQGERMGYILSIRAPCAPSHSLKHHMFHTVHPSTTCSTETPCATLHSYKYHVLHWFTEAPCTPPHPSRHHVLHLVHPGMICPTSSIQAPCAPLLH